MDQNQVICTPSLPFVATLYTYPPHACMPPRWRDGGEAACAAFAVNEAGRWSIEPLRPYYCSTLSAHCMYNSSQQFFPQCNSEVHLAVALFGGV